MAKIAAKSSSQDLQPQERAVRKNFTMPNSELELIGMIQSRCRKHDVGLNDSEVVRAGLKGLIKLGDREFVQVVKSVVRLKRGFTAKNKNSK